MQWKRIVLLVFIFLDTAGCVDYGSYRLEIIFPDEQAESSTAELSIWATHASVGWCERLVAGTKDPDDTIVYSTLVIEYPPTSVRRVPDVPAGSVIFFCEGRNADAATILRGCTKTMIQKGATVDVPIELEWTCRPAAEGEIPDNQQDDDCDGLVDECDRDEQCDDGNPCTTDLCSDHECHFSNLPDQLQCTDQNSCTEDDRCLGGECLGQPVDCSAYDGPCVQGECNPQAGACEPKVLPNDTECQDGLYCTEQDACAEGRCLGAPIDCEDGDVCTRDVCNEAEDRCNHLLEPRPGLEGQSVGVSCQNLLDDDCDGLTDKEDPNCRDCTDDLDCQDSNDCTQDLCVTGECVNQLVPDGTSCEDGYFCSVDDVCTAGVCQGSLRDCSGQADQCNSGVCSESGDACVAQPVTDGTGCTDGLFCTEPDSCTAGICGGAARNCSDNDTCTDDDCDEAADQCTYTLQPIPGAEGSPVPGTCTNQLDDDCDGLTDGDDSDCTPCTVDADCQDGNSCTRDICLGTVCENITEDDGTGCDDGLYCSDPDTCTGGVCGGPARDCDDFDSCTLNLCDEDTDQCDFPYDPIPGVDDICGDHIDQDCDGIPDGCCHGDGTLTDKADFATAASPRSVAIGDYNSDNIPDLAVACGFANSVSILLGDGLSGRGNGSFTDYVEYPTGQAPEWIATADFNADHILDLAVNNFDSGSVSILLGNGDSGRGDGTFAPKVDYSTGGEPQGLLCADLDGDHIQDLAVCDSLQHQLTILLGNGSNGRGDGTFAAAVSYPTGDEPYNLAAGDFNSDGILDLAVANFFSANVSVFIGVGDGTFLAKVDYTVGDGPTFVVAIDADEDDILDLVVPTILAGDIQVLWGDGTDGQGDGTFTLGSTVSAGFGLQVVAIGDLDFNGIADLAAANFFSAILSVFPGGGSNGQADGSFGLGTNYTVNSIQWDIDIDDFNADAVPDVVVPNRDSHNVSVLLGHGSGGHGDGTYAPGQSYPVMANAFRVSLADFNEDDILDAAVISDWGTDVGILLGDGTDGVGLGTFAAMVSYPVSQLPTALATADFDADGILDLAVASSLSVVSVLLGNGSDGRGDGSFAVRVDYPVTGVPSALVAGDFNADGCPDLASSSWDGSVVSVLTGGGDGSFDPKVDFASCSAPADLLAGDLNSDGILDLVLPSSDQDSVCVLTGDGSDGQGNGAFTHEASYPVGQHPVSIESGDFNSDGILDLSVSNEEDHTMSVLLGDGADGQGDGSFSAATHYPTGQYPNELIAVDFDFNGVLDLLVIDGAGGADGTISVFRGLGADGQGTGGFNSRTISIAGGTPRGLALGDLDEDGIYDLVITGTADADSLQTFLGGGKCLPRPQP